MKHYSGLIVSALLSIGFYQTSMAQQDQCPRREVARLISEAQSLADKLSPLPGSIVPCNDLQLKEQVIFWTAFYHDAMKLEQEDLAKTYFPGPSDSSAASRIVHAARLGQVEQLQTAIRDGELLIVENRANTLTLARSLARLGRHRQALNLYEEYLKQYPDDELADGEYLYVLIWSEDFLGSQARLLRLKSFELTPYLSELVKRAEFAIEKLDEQATDDGNDSIRLRGSFQVQFEHFEQEDDSQRRSFHARYQDQFYGQVGVHNLKSGFDPNSERASEFRLGGEIKLGQIFAMQTELGYFSSGNDNLFGQVGATANGQSWRLQVAAGRQPLSLTRMIPRVAQGIMKNEVFGTFEIKNYLELRSSLAQDGHLAPYESHRLELKLPAFIRMDGHESLILKLPFEYLAHPKPNPYYRTTPRSFATGVGFDYHRTIAEQYQLQTSWEYLLESRSSYLNTSSYQRLGRYQIQADLLYRIQPGYQLALGLDFLESERAQFERTAERRFSMIAGLHYQAIP